MESETYLFAGGGSGGHVFPGIAVAQEIQRRRPGARIVFVGSDRPVERSILQQANFRHYSLPVKPLHVLRRNPWAFLRGNWAAWNRARRILSDERPRAVIGLGGFVSAPAVCAAWRRRIPVTLLEQNAIPGAATRWLARCARQICLSFPNSATQLPAGRSIVITGNPVRREILELAERRRRAALDPRRRSTLLILGGSQGAKSLNEAILQLIPELAANLVSWRVVHQTGPEDAAVVRAGWRRAEIDAVVEDFFPNIAEHYVEADLAISRAGATTLAELAAFGCPSVLVPYPFAADRHQAANAECFVRQGAALMVSPAENSQATAGRLHDPIRTLLTDSRRRAEMSTAARELARPHAARDIVDLLFADTEHPSRMSASTNAVGPPHRTRSKEPVA